MYSRIQLIRKLEITHLPKSSGRKLGLTPKNVRNRQPRQPQKKRSQRSAINKKRHFLPHCSQEPTEEGGTRRGDHEQQQVRPAVRGDDERGALAVRRARRREGLRGRAPRPHHKDLRAQRLHVSSYRDIFHGESLLASGCLCARLCVMGEAWTLACLTFVCFDEPLSRRVQRGHGL